MNVLLLVVLLPATAEPGCGSPAEKDPEPGSASRAVCGVSDLGSGVSGLPDRLWHLAVTGWPWLLAVVLVVLVLSVAVSVARRLLWVRAARRGYWVAITPPRIVDPVRYEKVWRVLDGLAARAYGGRQRRVRLLRRLRLLRMPMAFEVYADGRRLRAGLWLPDWVPYPVVAKSVVQAWPGSTAERLPVPTVDIGGAVAGYRLVPDALYPETGWLVDEPHPRSRVGRGVGGDRDLGTMWSALADPGGPLLLQVLVRPATRRRRAALRRAVRSPVAARRTGAAVAVDGLVWLLLRLVRLPLLVFDLFLPGPASSSSTANSPRAAGPVSPDALQRAAMSEAADKARDTPHLLVSVRVVAVRPSRGAASEAARSVADGFGEASRALWAVRLSRAAAAARHRRAGSGDWLLLTASELGVLAHLPADPAFYGFDTAALHRPLPGRTARAHPERPTRRGPGWSRRGWTIPPAEPATDDSDGWPDDDNDEDDSEDP